MLTLVEALLVCRTLMHFEEHSFERRDVVFIVLDLESFCPRYRILLPKSGIIALYLFLQMLRIKVLDGINDVCLYVL